MLRKLLLTTVAVIFCLVFLTTSFAVESKWFKLINDFYKVGIAKTGEIYESWKEGLAEQGLTLFKIAVEITILSEEICPNYPNQSHVIYQMKIRALCKDSKDEKITVSDVRKIFAEISTVEPGSIIGRQLIESEGLQISDGWEEKGGTIV